MSVLNRNKFVAMCAKYSHDVDLMTLLAGEIKHILWESFTCTVFSIILYC